MTTSLVPEAAVVGLLVSLLVAVLAPITLFVFFRRRTNLSFRNVAVGAGVFVLFALVLEQLVHAYVLRINPASSAWFHLHPVGFAAYGAIAAGLFEETGRYLGLRFAVKSTGNPGTALAYGLGHGGAESIIIGGFGIAAGLFFALLVNAGRLDPTLAALHLPPPAVAKLHASLAHLTLGLSLVGGAERLLALAIQIALSFIVWNAVTTRRVWLVSVAIALHAFTDMGAALLQAGVLRFVAAAEGWALVGLLLSIAVARALSKPSSPRAA